MVSNRVKTCHGTMLTALALVTGLLLPGGTPAHAGCATSGTTRTCTGDVGDAQSFDQPDQSAQTAFTFVFDQLTSTAMAGSTASDTPTVGFVVSGASNTSTSEVETNPGIAGPGQALEFNLDSSSPGFVIHSAGAPGVLVSTTGGNGNSPGEKEHSGEQTGNTGGAGGTGGSQSISLSNVSILASDDSALTVGNTGGNGGEGAEGFATSDGDGIGGAGGAGGSAGTAALNLTSVTLGNSTGASPALAVEAAGGAGGAGGVGKSKDYTGQGGAGGAGGTGGTVTVDVSGGLTVDAGAATGILLSAIGGAAGSGGLGDDLLDGKGNGGLGGKGGTGGAATLQSTDSGTIAVTASGLGGIVVQSVAGQGGGGGDGKSGSTGEGPADGGNGGQGGTGGSVLVSLPDNTVDITVAGAGAQGLLMRSYGGAGGDGGEGKGGRAKGGSGAGSGPGGSVFATINGSITTGDDESNGIFAHSVGGFAGEGGSASSSFVAYGAGSESAGDGGRTEVNWGGGTSAVITTSGDDADGIFAQSQGGGGGKGGKSSAFTSLSGSGSAGGDGGEVIVRANGGTVSALGDRSRALFAQSVGGGGGDGGGASGITKVGGSGGAGGAGGSVEVNNSAALTTSGADAQGIFAQSVGLGGGAARSVTGGITDIGGSGGDGGTGGAVTVVNVADITTKGDQSEGIFAQSAGGGGGRGASATAIGVDFSLAIGGGGGTGGHGGDVQIKDFIGGSGDKPTITTGGDMANGVMAQSIGGGGGHGGNAISISGALDPVDVSIALGGAGGAAGDGGAVTVNFDGAIATAGDQSIGLMATSVGGGGGSAGTTVAVAAAAQSLGLSVGGGGGGGGNGDAVTVCRGVRNASAGNCIDSEATAALTLQTEGDGAHGILAASNGGGGGHSGATIAASASPIASLDISVGGDGGAGGAGDDVFVYSSGGITTAGQAAFGILAKSSGGGGGSAYLTGAASAGGPTGFNVGIGGAGGDAGGSGAVTVLSIDSIMTTGSSSDGIAALSTAGSGGAGGAAFSADTVTLGNIGVDVGGAGGGGGTAGDVQIDWSGARLSTAAAQSVGLYAHSGAGSGGRGGTDVNGELASVGTVQVTIGGQGGAGGTAGKATVAAAGDITTAGSQSPAIAASSLGGNGGRGGASLSTTGGTQGSATVTLGGGGGTGGTAQDVAVTTSGKVTTTGTQSEGVFAQSQGGHGGAGGWVGEGGISTTAVDGEPAVNVAVSLGGSGGAGGSAGSVAITNNGQVDTGNFASDGLFAQSIGGGGGQGGAVYSGQLNLNTQNTFDASVTVGGSGGDGGAANDVGVTNVNSVTTTGENSNAIFAQSVGGDGGRGGASYNILANIQSQSNHSASYQVTVGGSGGDGAVGSTVGAANLGSLSTAGTSSAGIFAQSVGGNGGAGGNGGNMLFNLGMAPANSENTISVQATIAVGGSGGTGGNAGAVTATNGEGANIATTGQTSPGIFAQAVGGGGGDGGAASGYTLAVTGVCSISGVTTFSQSCKQSNGAGSNTTYSALVNIGGDGATGGDGGAVTVGNGGVIATAGTASNALIAQSVGGGGGTGGAASADIGAFTSNKIAGDIANVISDATSLDPYNALTSWTAFGLSLGGRGGAAGDGKSVIVGNTGTLSTTGEASYGIMAQSIGGGGGAGGAASSSSTHSLSIGGSGNGGGNGGAVTVNGGSGSAITTAGDAALGILAQSVGGGGGDSGNKKSPVVNPQLAISLGGKDGVSGDGGDVTVTNTATDITTGGRAATAIIAQSIGGGGGLALDGIAGAQGTISASGTDGAAGDGGSIAIAHDGEIRTAITAADSDSTAAHGIFAQSVGGGGGYAGTLVMGSSALFGNDLPIAPDGFTDTSGDGGMVTVTATGAITTAGGSSTGIFAQSVGGGGGAAGGTDSSGSTGSWIGNGGGSGKGGTVNVTFGATASDLLQTAGAGAHGIYAQSVGGPNGTNAAGTTVSITAIGSIATPGGGAHGIYAQSDGDGKGAIDITVAEGALVNGGAAATIPGAEDGAGIFIKGGTSNSVTNHGTIAAVSGIAMNINGTITPVSASTFALLAVPGQDSAFQLENYGVVHGNILSTGSAVTLANRKGGEIHAGPRHEVDHFVNEGILHVAGAGTVGETALAGDLMQAGDGVLSVELDLGSVDSDHITVGGSAVLGGTVAVTPMPLVVGSGDAISKSGRVEIVNALGGVKLDAAADLPHSAAMRFGLDQPSPESLQIAWDINFANDDILAAGNRNEDNVSRHLQVLFLDDILAAMAPQETAALLSLESAEEFATATESLSGEIYANTQLSTLYSARRFGDDLANCAAGSAEVQFVGENRCGWFRIRGGWFDQDSNSRSSGFDETGFRVAGGVQHQLADDVQIVFGAAYEHTSLDMDYADGDGDLMQLGLVARKQLGPAELAASLSGGVAFYDTHRNTFTNAKTDGDQTIATVSGQVRGAYTLEYGACYAMPRVDVGVDFVSSDHVNESGAGALDLRVDGSDNTYFSVQPALQFGGEFTSDGGTLVRPQLTIGVTQFFGGDSPAADASFRITPSWSSGFQSSAKLDRTYLDVTAGVEVFISETVSVDVSAFTSQSTNTDTYGGLATLEIRY